MKNLRQADEQEKPWQVDVIIPVYRPGRKLDRILYRLKRQTWPVGRIIIVNTERKYWNEAKYEKISGLEVYHVTKEEFDHGRTRNFGAGLSDADVMIFMTDDAVPANKYLVEYLVKALLKKGPEGENIAMAYARQLPDRECQMIERYTRSFNYPERSQVKTAKDLPGMGIKAYFASNVCCAYRKDIFEQQGGFITRTIFNEDMIYAAGVIGAGYGIAYVAQAEVIHSHNLTLRQQFRRNFDLAVSQADHPEIFDGLPAEGEGIRLVASTARWLIRQKKPWLVPWLVVVSGGKYLGYRLGRNYRLLPGWMVRRCSTNLSYWDKPGKITIEKGDNR